eukprot:1901794-Rhodomonas_salina.1
MLPSKCEMHGVVQPSGTRTASTCQQPHSGISGRCKALSSGQNPRSSLPPRTESTPARNKTFHEH